MKRTRLTESDLNRIVMRSVKEIIRESLEGVEDVPAYEVINRNMSMTEVDDILMSNLYDENNNCVGSLRSLHFKYDPTTNKMLGGNSLYENMDIDPENKGKFTKTQKETGKSTEELCHSKNPLTRKRANFARMAKRHFKPLKED